MAKSCSCLVAIPSTFDTLGRLASTSRWLCGEGVEEARGWIPLHLQTRHITCAQLRITWGKDDPELPARRHDRLGPLRKFPHHMG